MAFTLNTNALKSERNSSSAGKTVDYQLLNEHIVTQVGAAREPESMTGFISGIYQLGLQSREDFEGPVEVGKDYPEGAEFFEQGGKQMVRYPRKPVKMVALSVDFPGVLVDYSLYYTGESNPVPYRQLINNVWGSFDAKEGKRVQTVTGYPLTEMKHDDLGWACAKNSTLHKLASATGCLDERGLFAIDHLGELLGKHLQFDVHVFLKKEKNGDRVFLNERVNLGGRTPKSLPIPEFDAETYIHGLNFFGDNDPEMVKKIRKVVKDTVKRAIDYDQSDIKKVLDQIEGEAPKQSPTATPSQPATTVATTPRPKPTASPKPAPVAASWEDDDSDVPF
jgi:hypothetical protein